MTQDKPPAKHSSEAESRRVLEPVLAELKQGHGVEAVRRFGDVLDRGVVPADRGLLRWLAETIGKQATARLISAYARHPCFYCKKGLEPCESCHGSGRSGGANLCENCLTTGFARCDFCDGAGLATYNAIPEALRFPAALDRIKIAAKTLTNLLDQPVPKPRFDRARQCVKQCVQRVFEMNRLMGVFENALVLVKSLEPSGASPPALREKTMMICVRSARRGRKRICELLQCMAACESYEAKSAGSKPPARKLAENRAALFGSLAKSVSTFAGTALEHPFLYQEIAASRRMARGQKDSDSPSPGQENP